MRGAIGQLEFLEQFVCALAAFFGWDAEVSRVENQNLASREGEIVIGTLRHDSDQPLHCGLLVPDLMIANPGMATGCADSGRENANGRGFTRAVGPEQSEDFAGFDLKCQAIESLNLGLWLLRIFSVGARDQTSTGAERWRRVVDLAQIFCAYTNRHE